MEFSEILAAVYENTGYQSSPAAAVVTRVKRNVNRGQRIILSDPRLRRLVDSDEPLTFASVADQARYTLPEAVARVLGIFETTNDRALRAMSRQMYRIYEPDAASNTGTPTHYVPIGRVAVAVQPSDASEIFVDSTSGSDTGTAYLQVVLSGGYRRLLSVTMTGTTAVSFTLTNVIAIEDFYISAAAAGTVTLTEDAEGGTELARITIGAKRPRYYGFYLWPTPSAAVTYSVDYRRNISDLVNNTDEPMLPLDYHEMLVSYAEWQEWQLKDDEARAAQAKAQYDAFLSRLKYEVNEDPGEIPVMGTGRRIGRSRLGGQYPADYYLVG